MAHVDPLLADGWRRSIAALPPLLDSQTPGRPQPLTAIKRIACLSAKAVADVVGHGKLG